ncbi:hypothetical protein WR25_15576 [Diploscapter pachys]|uniref:DUF8117 domain-containing protein n=1 Tax=Diploscapter pachys TaxID=2018661 RepID=A0A2A2LAM4_9BILA|nr:hypothetical protein WR25_15576 [Diploscapter pachys]
MQTSLARLWWSRLVISVRGYVINYVQSDEQTLFHCDDAFIAIHRYLAESTSDKQEGLRFISDLQVIVTFPLISETLLALDAGKRIAADPFANPQTKESFERVFGISNRITYRIANGQKYAYVVFMKILYVLQQRWKSKNKERRSIRFETDPEWQPDDRVVLFQQFFHGNRTWVLCDFDRYILTQWRPQGATIIFGDRFVQKKQREGMKLCSYCGMIEQQIGQFPSQDGYQFCSPECLQGFTALPQTTAAQ